MNRFAATATVALTVAIAGCDDRTSSTVAPPGATYSYRVPTGLHRLYVGAARAGVSSGAQQVTAVGTSALDKIVVAHVPATFSYDDLSDSVLVTRLGRAARRRLFEANSEVGIPRLVHRPDGRALEVSVVPKPRLDPLVAARFAFVFAGRDEVDVVCQWTREAADRLRAACHEVIASLRMHPRPPPTEEPASRRRKDRERPRRTVRSQVPRW